MSRFFAPGRALVVGISDYSGRLKLPSTVSKDARDVAARLTDPAISAYRPEAVTLLTDRQATASAIREALKKAATDSAAGDTFLFYFSGHGHRIEVEGADHSLLVPIDIDLSDPAGSGILDTELYDLLRGITAERQIILLDACHSGGVGTLKSPASEPYPLGIGKGGLDDLGRGRGRVVLASSRPDETSLVLRGMANSVFTSALLDGLGGAARDRGDGTIGVFDLFQYVADNVPRRASQHPVFKADELEENFAIALKATSKAFNVSAEAAPLPRTAQVEALLATLYPLGPLQNEIWSRAGGDLSRLSLTGHGAALWHSALRLVSQGGGLSLSALLETAAEEYPDNATLAQLRAGKL